MGEGRQIPLTCVAGPYGFEILQAYQTNIDQNFKHIWSQSRQGQGSYLEMDEVAQALNAEDNGIHYQVGSGVLLPLPQPRKEVVEMLENVAIHAVAKATVKHDTPTEHYCMMFGELITPTFIKIDLGEKNLAAINAELAKHSPLGMTTGFADLVEMGVYAGVDELEIKIVTVEEDE